MAEAGGGLRRRDKKARSDGRSGQQEAATDKRATGKPAATQKLSGAERSWSSDASGTKRVGTRAIMIGCGVVVYLWYTGSLFAAVKWAAIVFSGLLAMLFFKQNSMLYAPNPPQMAAAMAMMRELTPKVLSIEYEDAQIATADGLTLHGWFILQPAAVRSSVPTLVFFHGNAGSIVGRLKNFVELMVGLQCNVLAVDYRGYGRSEGKPTEAGLCEDARASLRYVGGRDDIDKSKVVVFGRSLGGAVALRLAADVEAGKVEGVAPCCYMIENSFTSVQEMASKLIWWVAPLLRMAPFFLRNKWESENAIASVRSPIMLISGTDDELIPPEMMERLRAAAVASTDVAWYTVPGGGHNNTFSVGGDAYYDTLREFVQKHTEGREETTPSGRTS